MTSATIRECGTWDDRTRWALVALVALPVVVGGLAALGREWHPASDWALIELAVRDVGADTPLVGPFSRFGWNHPGPMLFWVLAVPYRILGSSSTAVLTGAAALNVACIGGIGWIAHRRGGWPLLAWTSALLALLLLGAPDDLLVDPWNPSIVVLPFALLMLLSWSLTAGDHRLAPLWVLVASFILQSHVGYAPVVVVLGAWALIWLLRTHGRTAVPWLAGAAALGLALWLPPLIQQLTGDPGNLGEIAGHFLDTGRSTVGPGRAGEVFGRHLAPFGIWMGGGEPTDPFTGELVGGSAWAAVPLLAAFGAATWFAARARARESLLLAGQTALTLVVGFVAASRITGEVYPYLFGWLEVLAMFLWLSAGWSLYTSIGSELRARVRPVAVPVLVAVTGLVSIVTTVDAWRIDLQLPGVSESVEAVAPAVVDAADDRSLLILPRGSCLHAAAYGVALQLDRAGVPIVSTEEWSNRYGDHRVWDGSNADVRVTVVCGNEVDEALAEAADRDDIEVVARHDTLHPSEQTELEDLERELRERVVELGRPELLQHFESDLIVYSAPAAGVDPELVGRYRDLRERAHDRVAVLFEPLDGSSA